MSRHRYTDEELTSSIKRFAWYHPYGFSLSALLKSVGSSRQRLKRLVDAAPFIEERLRDVDRPELGKKYVWDWDYHEPASEVNHAS